MKYYVIIFSFLLAYFPVAGQEAAQPFTLDEAVKYGLENSLSVRNAYINVADAAERVKEVRSIGMPKLKGGINWQYFFKLPASLVPAQFFDPNAPEGEFAKITFGTKNNLAASLDFNALVFDGSFFVGLQAADAYRDFVTLDIEKRQKEVRDAITAAYLPPLAIEESKKILGRNIKNLERVLFETKALYKEGFVEQLDVDRLELSLANLKTEVDNLDRQSELAYNALKFLMGFPIEAQMIAVDDVEKLLVPASDEELTTPVNYRSRPEYNMIEGSLHLLDYQIKVYKMGYYPSVFAFASYQYSAQGNNLFKDPAWIPTGVAGLQLSVPIFDGLEKKTKIQRTRLQMEQMRNQQRDLERAISLEVQNARKNYLLMKKRSDDQNRNVALAEKIYRVTQTKYKEGVGSSLELTQAEQGLYQAQANYTQARLELLQARVALQKALGK